MKIFYIKYGMILPAVAALLLSCSKEPQPEVRVEEVPEAEILAMVPKNVPNTAFYKDIFLDGGCELNPGIKENGKVINGRLPYALAKAGIREAEYFLSTIDDVGDGWVESDQAIQNSLIMGSNDDSNGVLLYPDGEPRFRMIYVFGGHSGPHGNTLGLTGRANVNTFYRNGGSYVGSCAGAYLAGHFASGKTMTYFNIWREGNMIGTGVGNSSIEMVMESDVFSSYFGPVKGTLVEDIRHNGGGFMDVNTAPAGTEIIARFRNERGKDSSKARYYGQPSVWAYKESEYTGRMVVTGSHPEDAPSGPILDLTSSMMAYAWDGVGAAKVKGVLRRGDMIPETTGIGDLQCHHYVLYPGADIKSLKLSLWWSGDYDLELYLKRGSFAFPDADPEYSSTVPSGGRNELETGPLVKDLWYVTVRCATTVESEEVITDKTRNLGRHFVYSGKTGVLNGVPYSISADWKY